jgi:hypothetical protein
MFKQIATLGFLLAVAFHSYADDSARIQQLEKEIQQINARLAKLESIAGGSNNASKPFASVDGWKSIANWRRLATGMSATEVQQILGEPDRVDGGVAAYWRYQNGGEVGFLRGELQRWREPKK